MFLYKKFTSNLFFATMYYKIGLLLFLILKLCSCNQNIKFDSEKWKNADGENITLDTRLNMTNDLIESKILINKSEIEIIELLGSPTRLSKDNIKSIKYFAVQEIYGWDIDPEEMTFIKIVFNNEGRSSFVELCSTN